MNKHETAKILAIAAGFDNRRPDDLATAAWLELLGGQTYEQCREAIIDHYRDPETRHKYLTAAHVLDRVEGMRRAKFSDIEADVRAAKARGLLDASHPVRQPLPAEVQAALRAARERDRAASLKYLDVSADSTAASQ